ncbi:MULTISPECIES: hypothetical protein [Cyanophyceae]|uniref:hypothetical protein n=1 Tax=Cyanophyceae TaxID=3028117 RepID=UPI0016863888|nr:MULTISPECIES: hypothetical protein [Cyanophyceae]MBD1915045.1 hypothetical protein [Phormidium sp. FACHB-77]MBD2030793.1 hypothetical protein [Phormidium sp. FACHB-322]MBD2053146.1 hypothetical protein [Leptolyngbya sp. FACHB-60]
MKTSIRFPALVGISLLTTALLACSAGPPAAPPETSAPQNEAATPSNWANILGPISAPPNWQVEPCVNEVLLCVEADGDLIGTVERFSHPLSEVPVQGGLPLPEGSELEFLQAWVSDHYRTIEADRQGADPALKFVGETPVAISIGTLPGLRYGYTITHPNGALFDRGIGYVTTDGTMLHVFATGVISGDPSGSFSDEELFETFLPHLNTTIQGLKL